MNVTIKAFGLASAFLKENISTVELPIASTVDQLIAAITTTEKGLNLTMLKGATFLVNKENAYHDTVLQEGDEVFIMVRMAGGYK